MLYRVWFNILDVIFRFLNVVLKTYLSQDFYLCKVYTNFYVKLNWKFLSTERAA